MTFEVAHQKSSGYGGFDGSVLLGVRSGARESDAQGSGTPAETLSAMALELDILSIEALFCFDGNLLSIAVNNYSICALYLKKISEAVLKLEQLIFDDPAANLKDPIIFNLCTLYDLSCTPELSQNKKKVLHAVSLAYHISDPILNWKNFRLNS